MGKALLIISMAAVMGGAVMMLQMQGTEHQTATELAKVDAEFFAREAARSGYEVGMGDLALNFTPQDGRTGVETANVAQGTYDLAIEETPAATIAVTATGRAGYRGPNGQVVQAEHTMWGEFARYVETPSAVVIDAEEAVPSFAQSDFSISGNDARPASTASAGAAPASGLGSTSYAVLATQPGVAATLRSGLGGSQASRIAGRGDDSEGGAVAQGDEVPALLQSIYDEAMARVQSGESDAISYVGDRVFAGMETFGSSPGVPKIVRIDGDVTVKGKVQGYGVLIVEGNLTIEGDAADATDNFVWEGLVYVRQEGEVTFSQTGRTRIEGGLVVQAPPAETDDEPIDFDIDDEGEITVNERFAARVEVLGAAISNGGAYDVPVTLEIGIDGDTYTPWGNNDYPVDANINDDRNPRSFDLPDLYDAGERIVVEARSFLRYGGKSGQYNSHWREFIGVRSGGSNNRLVKVLRDEDRVPQISGFLNQTAIAGYVDDYVVNGRVRLADNQAIYLFELGTTDTRSAAADFQDAVVLVTLSKETEVVAHTEGSESAGSGTGEPLPTSRVNFTVGGDAVIQYSTEAIGRLATHLQSARAAATLGSLKQRSFDPTQTHEVMPAEPTSEQEDVEIGDDVLVTVCLDGETQTITVGAFNLLGEGAALGACVGTNGKATVCHRQGTPNTLEVGVAALPAHLAHGDTVGACSAEDLASGSGNSGSGSGNSSNGNSGSGNSSNGDVDGDDEGGDDEDGGSDGGGYGGLWDWLFG